MSESWGFETKQVHAGAEPDPTTGARAVPIYQTTSYVFRDTEHAAALFGLEELGNIYTRIMNPTQAVFEDRIAALEGGVGALATASGQAARDDRAAEPRRERRPHRRVGVAVRRHVQPAALHVPEARAWRSASSTTPTTSTRGRRRSGRTRRRSTARASATRRATSSTSRASPTIAHANDDPARHRQHASTSPYLCQPLQHGADIVVHSATKFIGGHGTSIGGIIVDGGKFDYVASGRFPNFTEPDPSYHGLVFSQLPEPLRPAQYILKARLQYQRDIGARGVAVQRVPLPPGPRDAEPAHGAALRRTRSRSRSGSRRATRWSGSSYPGPRVEPVERARRRSTCRTGQGAILVVRHQGRARGRASASSTASSCSATSPTSATCAASRSTPRPPRTSSSRPTSRSRPA